MFKKKPVAQEQLSSNYSSNKEKKKERKKEHTITGTQVLPGRWWEKLVFVKYILLLSYRSTELTFLDSWGNVSIVVSKMHSDLQNIHVGFKAGV